MNTTGCGYAEEHTHNETTNRKKLRSFSSQKHYAVSTALGRGVISRAKELSVMGGEGEFLICYWICCARLRRKEKLD